MDKRVLRELQTIPGVGPRVARDLYAIGIRKVADLRNKNPERLYEAANRWYGKRQDRCLLYVFRCAVYFAGTKRPKRELLQWWHWKDHSPSPRLRRSLSSSSFL